MLGCGGILASWHPGILASWHPGILASWHPGMLEAWHAGVLVCCSPGDFLRGRVRDGMIRTPSEETPRSEGFYLTPSDSVV